MRSLEDGGRIARSPSGMSTPGFSSPRCKRVGKDQGWGTPGTVYTVSRSVYRARETRRQTEVVRSCPVSRSSGTGSLPFGTPSGWGEDVCSAGRGGYSPGPHGSWSGRTGRTYSRQGGRVQVSGTGVCRTRDPFPTNPHNLRDGMSSTGGHDSCRSRPVCRRSSRGTRGV